ncbi:MAG TPA: protoglobin domain-containing protein, partial [Quisquiliibacterium sp.]|nr:protoglobin domain-containing protein [Quisquiliibacterium sp.]
MKPLASTVLALTLATALPVSHAQQQASPAVPGYAYGQPTLAKAPYTLADLQALQKSLLFTEEDVKALRQSKAILADQTDAILEVWYGFVGATPELVH